MAIELIGKVNLESKKVKEVMELAMTYFGMLDLLDPEATVKIIARETGMPTLKDQPVTHVARIGSTESAFMPGRINYGATMTLDQMIETLKKKIARREREITRRLP